MLSAEETQNLKGDGSGMIQEHSRACYLRWTNITKTVQVAEASVGLIKSSIGGDGAAKKAGAATADKSNSAGSDKDGMPSTNEKIILNQVSGEAKPGEVLALMGPSGSGKTSLLDVLASRSAYNDGTISLNSDNMTNNSSKMKALRRKIAYVKQQDIFFNHLSVKDQLMYTAFLRMGDAYSKEQKMAEVTKVISLLRLEKCADTPIMLVSGGERKRVNIGTELLTNPSIIMLDEPTSGLDSTSAVALMSLLGVLAKEHGKTIITSIHQPSSAIFRAFDKVMYLADGCVVYFGTPSDSLSYVKKLGMTCPDGYNAADHWMDLLVEDSAITHGAKEEGGDGGDEPSFPIKLNDTSTSTTNSKNDLMVSDGSSEGGAAATTSKKPKKLRTMLSKRFSNMVSQKGGAASDHLLVRTKKKRDEYILLKTTKARLITSWDVDSFAQKIEGGADDVEGGSVRSAGTSDAGMDGEMVEKKFNTSWMTQFYILMHRSLKNSSSAILTPLNFFKSIALAILTGLLWFRMPNDELHFRDRASLLFFSNTYWIFDGTFTAIFTFPTERAIIFKERASGSYYLSAYFLSKTLSEMPTRLSLPATFWVITYWMAGVNPSIGVFFGTLGCMLLSVLAGESYGLLCGALVMDLEKAMTIMVVISLTAMAAGGFYIQNIPEWLVWVKYTSPFRFGYEATQILVFDREIPCDGSGGLAEFCKDGVESVTSEQALEALNSEGTVAFNLGILLILVFVPRYLSFLALKSKRGAERS